MTDNGAEVLAAPMRPNDAFDRGTIRDYLVALLAQVWEHSEGFSGKRPFGDSGWQMHLHDALVDAGMVTATEDRWGDLTVQGDQARLAYELISDAIQALRQEA